MTLSLPNSFLVKQHSSGSRFWWPTEKEFRGSKSTIRSSESIFRKWPLIANLLHISRIIGSLSLPHPFIVETNWLDLGQLLLGAQDPLVAGQCSSGGYGTRNGSPPRGHRGQLARFQSDRPTKASDRRDQRQPYPPLQHQHTSMGQWPHWVSHSFGFYFMIWRTWRRNVFRKQFSIFSYWCIGIDLWCTF